VYLATMDPGRCIFKAAWDAIYKALLLSKPFNAHTTEPQQRAGTSAPPSDQSDALKKPRADLLRCRMRLSPSCNQTGFFVRFCPVLMKPRSSQLHKTAQFERVSSLSSPALEWHKMAQFSRRTVLHP
jgi:hypothetical protein